MSDPATDEEDREPTDYSIRIPQSIDQELQETLPAHLDTGDQIRHCIQWTIDTYPDGPES